MAGSSSALEAALSYCCTVLTQSPEAVNVLVNGPIMQQLIMCVTADAAKVPLPIKQCAAFTMSLAVRSAAHVSHTLTSDKVQALRVYVCVCVRNVSVCVCACVCLCVCMRVCMSACVV